MKNKILPLIVLVALIPLMTACGSKPSETETKPNETGSESSSTESYSLDYTPWNLLDVDLDETKEIDIDGLDLLYGYPLNVVYSAEYNYITVISVVPYDESDGVTIADNFSNIEYLIMRKGFLIANEIRYFGYTDEDPDKAGSFWATIERDEIQQLAEGKMEITDVLKSVSAKGNFYFEHN